MHSKDFSDARISKYGFLIIALLCYAIAITFKEPAIILGPIFIVYWLIFRYSEQPLWHWPALIIKDRQNLQITFLLALVTLLLALYLTSPWPSLLHHPYYAITIKRLLHAAKELIVLLLQTQQSKDYPLLPWVRTACPLSATIAIWMAMAILAVGTVFLLIKRRTLVNDYRQTLAFLLIAVLLSLLLPLFWYVGPWHLSLTLLLLGLIIGFMTEWLGNLWLLKTVWMNCGITVIVTLLGLTAYQVNQQDSARYQADKNFFYGMSLGKNAVLSPPPLQNRLDPNSVLVVEDSLLQVDYLLGASSYPTQPQGERQIAIDTMDHLTNFIQTDPIYGGTLFRLAYLKPHLNEEIYPFTIQHMDNVPLFIIYHWLLHQDDIYCVGYDAEAHWHDRTLLFKQYLRQEAKKRAIVIHHYQPSTEANLTKMADNHYRQMTLLPEPEYCQFLCDQDVSCHGYTYHRPSYTEIKPASCRFY